MATLYAGSNGSLLSFAPTQQVQQLCSPNAPEGTAATLDFDESANAAIADDINAAWGSGIYTLRMVNGSPQLQKNGVAVFINAANALYALQPNILSGVPEVTLKAAIVALWNGTATAAQQQRALAYCLLKLHQAGTI